MLNSAPSSVETLEIVKHEEIAASLGVVFQSILDLLGPESELPGGVAYPMTLEAWPGGRWFRDLGPGVGHFWGHVQVIKPPKLLEICGPLFMSYPAVSHVQYRLTESDGGTHLALTHRAMGLISAEHREGVHEGWAHELAKIRETAERRAGK